MLWKKSSANTGMLVQGREKRAIEATHEPLVDSSTFDAIQKSFQARAYNVVPQGQPADNILKGKMICGCCGGKMQRKRGTNHADWYFFTFITKNRLGTDKCTRMYAREEDIYNAIYHRLKDYVNEHYITNSAYKQKIQEYMRQIADLTQRKASYEKKYAMFRKLLSASDRGIPLSEIVDCIDKVVVDGGAKNCGTIEIKTVSKMAYLPFT